MNRFFIDPAFSDPGQFRIGGSDLHHIRKVLRLRVGEIITVVTPDGREWEARLDRIDGSEAAGTLLSDVSIQREADLSLTLVQGLPKGTKMDDIIQKGTEVGMTAFIPLICERSIVRLDKDQGATKSARWQKIAEEAAKQARRTVIPSVSLPMSWDRVLSQKPDDTVDILLWEQEEKVSLKQVWQQYGPMKKVRIFCGPEGGFSSGEAEKAISSGAHAVTLGPRILRTETAGLVAAAALLYASDDLGGRR